MTGELPPLARLALAYASARARPDWLTVLALDARLAGVVRQAREPMLAQMRLAWWRDRFAADPASWPKGEPLLQRLAEWGAGAAGLAPLVDGWEALLGEGPLETDALAAFAEGRVAAMAALAVRLDADCPGIEIIARRWALADLALHLGNANERERAAALLPGGLRKFRISKPMRPLTIMAGLNARAVARGLPDALNGPGALISAIRLGFWGG